MCFTLASVVFSFAPATCLLVLLFDLVFRHSSTVDQPEQHPSQHMLNPHPHPHPTTTSATHPPPVRSHRTSQSSSPTIDAAVWGTNLLPPAPQTLPTRTRSSIQTQKQPPLTRLQTYNPNLSINFHLPQSNAVESLRPHTERPHHSSTHHTNIPDHAAVSSEEKTYSVQTPLSPAAPKTCEVDADGHINHPLIVHDASPTSVNAHVHHPHPHPHPALPPAPPPPEPPLSAPRNFNWDRNLVYARLYSDNKSSSTNAAATAAVCHMINTPLLIQASDFNQQDVLDYSTFMQLVEECAKEHEMYCKNKVQKCKIRQQQLDEEAAASMQQQQRQQNLVAPIPKYPIPILSEVAHDIRDGLCLINPNLKINQTETTTNTNTNTSNMTTSLSSSSSSSFSSSSSTSVGCSTLPSPYVSNVRTLLSNDRELYSLYREWLKQKRDQWTLEKFFQNQLDNLQQQYQQLLSRNMKLQQLNDKLNQQTNMHQSQISGSDYQPFTPSSSSSVATSTWSPSHSHSSHSSHSSTASTLSHSTTFSTHSLHHSLPPTSASTHSTLSEDRESGTDMSEYAARMRRGSF